MQCFVRVDAEIKAFVSERSSRWRQPSRSCSRGDATSGAARGTRGIRSALSRFEIIPVIFKIRRDTPWWKLLENFARRTGTWNSVVLIPSGFRAPSGPKARRVRFAIIAYTHWCDKYCSRVYVYAAGPSRRSRRFTRVWVNTALCESISRACSVVSLRAARPSRGREKDGRMLRFLIWTARTTSARLAKYSLQFRLVLVENRRRSNFDSCINVEL